MLYLCHCRGTSSLPYWSMMMLRAHRLVREVMLTAAGVPQKRETLKPPGNNNNNSNNTQTSYLHNTLVRLLVLGKDINKLFNLFSSKCKNPHRRGYVVRLSVRSIKGLPLTSPVILTKIEVCPKEHGCVWWSIDGLLVPSLNCYLHFSVYHDTLW